MKKKGISYDELVVGLILKFGSIDINDISVLMDMMKINDFSSFNQSGIGKYIKENKDNRYEFNMEIVSRNYELIDDFYSVVQNFQGITIKSYLEELDLFQFMLRKIKKIGNISEDSYKNNFSGIQMVVVDRLKKLGYLTNDKRLSKRGKLYLFLIDSNEIISKFSKELRDNGYNNRLLETFLIGQDLERDIQYMVENVFTLDCFFEFCDSYGIDPYVLIDEVKTDNVGRSRVKVSKKRFKIQKNNI